MESKSYRLNNKTPNFEEIQTRTPWDQLPTEEKRVWVIKAHEAADRYQLPEAVSGNSWVMDFYEIYTMVDLEGRPLDAIDHQNLTRLKAGQAKGNSKRRLF